MCSLCKYIVVFFVVVIARLELFLFCDGVSALYKCRYYYYYYYYYLYYQCSDREEMNRMSPFVLPKFRFLPIIKIF